MIKLLAAGTLAYVGYRYVQAHTPRGLRHDPVAGGPLSDRATVQSDPDRPPTNDPYVGAP